MVALRSLQKLGFPTIGAFMEALFGGHYNTHRSVYQAITSFLKSSENNTLHHPAHLIDLIYQNPHAQIFNGIHNPQHPTFVLPRHALPSSSRSIPIARVVEEEKSTRNALLNWALQIVLERVDKEAELLLEPSLGFCKSDTVTWDSVLRWSLADSQETISTQAPVIFAVLSTLAVNNCTRKRLEGNALDTASSLDVEAVAEGADDLGHPTNAMDVDTEALKDDEGPVGRRDPWLVSCFSHHPISPFDVFF